MNLNDDTKGDIKRTFFTIIFFLWQNKTLYRERHAKDYVIDSLQPGNERGNKTWLAQRRGKIISYFEHYLII